MDACHFEAKALLALQLQLKADLFEVEVGMQQTAALYTFQLPQRITCNATQARESSRDLRACDLREPDLKACLTSKSSVQFSS